MISACTRYVPGGTPVIVYRPAESVRASNRVPATVMRTSLSGAPVSCARTTPAIVPVSWARAIWGGNSTASVRRKAGRRVERTDGHVGSTPDGQKHARAARRRSCHMGPSELARNWRLHREAQSACPQGDARHQVVTGLVLPGARNKQVAPSPTVISRPAFEVHFWPRWSFSTAPCAAPGSSRKRIPLRQPRLLPRSAGRGRCDPADGGAPRRAGAGRRDVVPGAVRDRRARALRPAVLLRLHGARLRLVARAGDLRERAQQAPGGTAVRFSGRVDGGPLRPAPSDGGRNPHGGHRARRARHDPHARRLLSLLSFQRARQRLRRPAPEPGLAVALVHRSPRPRHGLRLPRHRPRRYAGAVARRAADARGRVARRPAGARRVDHRRGAAAGARRQRAPPESRAPSPEPRFYRSRPPCARVLSAPHRQHVLDRRGGRYEPAPEAVPEPRPRVLTGRGGADRLARPGLEPRWPPGGRVARGSLREEVRDAADLFACRLGHPAAPPDGWPRHDLSVCGRLRPRSGRRIHGHPADGRRVVRRARAGAHDGRGAHGGWDRRSSRALGRRPDARRVRQLHEWLPGAHRLRADRSDRGGSAATRREAVRIGIIMNGVTGRMGLNQHLVGSIVAIRRQGGVTLPGGGRVVPDPILVGRSEAKLREIARAHGIERVSTDLDSCLANPADAVYFDATLTSARVDHVRRAIAAGKHVYCEKPLAPTTVEALDLARAAERANVKHGVVQDKLFLPGVRKLKQLVKDGFFGRILSVRGEFGYWVFEGDDQPAQRPSWNYRKEDGGGIILDMFAHWRYLLDHTFGGVTAVHCTGATHIPTRVDENGPRA